MTAPTRLIGMVDDRQFGTLVSDVYEHIPDLLYPNSIEIYGQMRRDSRLAAILDGYVLQIRRAQWQLDGAGCRPEVTQFVADCLGLNVVGEDKAGGARRRGVSWNDHLRSALLSLVWGHYAFEMQAEVVDGRARLTTLAERIPGTISAIHADPKTGALLGIDQLMTSGTRSPQISADRLVFYSRNREGSSWQGNSLIRSAYPNWLLKREMIRVNAISNRRWGAGVPVAQALPGTAPTPGQMAEAQKMASAARAGDQAGASMPPNFDLKIVGLSGAVPDTLGFIRFLNQEMAQSVLMPHIDLGTTESGSRSLGGSFIDSWTLALESEAESIADTATRQIAARIVDFNWGDDEPVPRVVTSGIGSRREVTAESLDLLMRAGALSADPGLESWIRREYRLPERSQDDAPAGKSYQYDLDFGILTVDERRAQIGLPPLANGQGAALPEPSSARIDPTTPTPAPPPAPVASASRKRAPRRSRKEPASGQLALPILAAARQPTTEELAAGVDPAAIQAQWQQQVDEQANDWQQVADPMTEEIVAAIVAAIAAGMFADLVASGGLVVPAAVVAAMATPIAAGMLALGSTSAAQVVSELAAQGVTIDAPAPDAATVAAHAHAAAQVIASGYTNGAAQVALANAGPEADAETVGERVREHLDGVTSTAVANDPNGRGWVVGNLGSVMSQAQGMGRMAAFQALEAAGHAPAYVASEVNDSSVCLNCSEIDGTRFDTLAEAVAAYPLGQYYACLGGTRCRGFLFAALSN